MSHAEDQSGDRRDFLYYATAGVGAVAVGAGVWPLVNQMNPSADVQAASQMRVDVSGVAVGTQLTVLFLGKPVFIRHRTEAEITDARAVDLGDLVDDASRNVNNEGTDAADVNRSTADFSGENTGEWLIVQGVCTHLGCVPLSDAGDYVGSGGVGGWFCPCHGSHYDTSGRIRRGPAPENLPIPPVEFVDESTILLG